MAVFKSLPNYEYNKSRIYAHFNGDGIFESTDENVIAGLEKAKPFIERVDKLITKSPAKPAAKAAVATKDSSKVTKKK